MKFVEITAGILHEEQGAPATIKDFFFPWLCKLEELVTEALQCVVPAPGTDSIPDHFKIPVDAVAELMEPYHKRWVITGVDKLANNFVVVCKRFYLQFIKRDLLNSSFYRILSTSETDLMYNKIQATNELLGFKTIMKPGLLAALFKSHKHTV